VVPDESADAGECVTDRLRVESASVTQAQCDVTVSGLLGADDGLVGNQAGLSDTGAQTAAVRSRDLGTQTETGAASGESCGVRQFGLGDRENDQLSGGEPGGEGTAVLFDEMGDGTLTLPMMLRWTMTGRCLAPSAPM
jgi:hypothetical protein